MRVRRRGLGRHRRGWPGIGQRSRGTGAAMHPLSAPRRRLQPAARPGPVPQPLGEACRRPGPWKRPPRPAAAQGMRRVWFRGRSCRAGPRSRLEKARPAPATEACRTPRAGPAGLLSAPCRPSRMGCRRAPPAGMAGVLRRYFRRGPEPHHGRTAPAYPGALPRLPLSRTQAQAVGLLVLGPILLGHQFWSYMQKEGRRPITPIGRLDAPAFLRGPSRGRAWDMQ